MSPHHALIIDDNLNNTEVLAMLLESQGLSHTSLTSVRSLAATLDSLVKVDIIFLDLEFPNYSGFHILADLRQDPRLDHVPVVAYSVHTSEVNEARDAGFHSFLGKPLNAQRFPDQLRDILNNQHVWDF